MTGHSSAAPIGALGGLRIADFSRVLAGPYATMLLGDLGADVVKIERPGTGDDTRSWGPPFVGDTATYFSGVNRNKQSVVVDLATPDGRDHASALIDSADVVVENFKPGTMDRLGLGYEHASARNPALVFCSISGFGVEDGADLPGYDLLVQAAGGLMSITGTADGPPTKAGVALVDVVTGLHATVGILAAIRHRDLTGVGQRVEVNLLSSQLSAMVNQSAAFAQAGVTAARMGNAHPSIAPYELMPTADGDLVVAVGNDRQFAALCSVLELPELAIHPRYATNTARVQHRPSLSDLLTARLRQHPRDHWIALLTAAGVPAGPVNSIAEGFALADRLGLTPVVALPDGTPTVANPIGLSTTPPTYRSSAPGLGEHTPQALTYRRPQ